AVIRRRSHWCLLSSSFQPPTPGLVSHRPWSRNKSAGLISFASRAGVERVSSEKSQASAQPAAGCPRFADRPTEHDAAARHAEKDHRHSQSRELLVLWSETRRCLDFSPPHPRLQTRQAGRQHVQVEL